MHAEASLYSHHTLLRNKKNSGKSVYKNKIKIE